MGSIPTAKDFFIQIPNLPNFPALVVFLCVENEFELIFQFGLKGTHTERSFGSATSIFLVVLAAPLTNFYAVFLNGS
jgi:hypothetical protein